MSSNYFSSSGSMKPGKIKQVFYSLFQEIIWTGELLALIVLLGSVAFLSPMASDLMIAIFAALVTGVIVYVLVLLYNEFKDGG